jgi:hypothetical protein
MLAGERLVCHPPRVRYGARRRGVAPSDPPPRSANHWNNSAQVLPRKTHAKQQEDTCAYRAVASRTGSGDRRKSGTLSEERSTMPPRTWRGCPGGADDLDEMDLDRGHVQRDRHARRLAHHRRVDRVASDRRCFPRCLRLRARGCDPEGARVRRHRERSCVASVCVRTHDRRAHRSPRGDEATLAARVRTDRGETDGGCVRGAEGPEGRADALGGTRAAQIRTRLGSSPIRSHPRRASSQRVDRPRNSARRRARAEPVGWGGREPLRARRSRRARERSSRRHRLGS